MSLLLGIDLGTSYFKVGLFDETGVLKGLGRMAVTPRGARAGIQELPVEIFWELLRDGLAEALRQAGANAEDIAGLAYSSQANTFLLLDREAVPLTPLVLWTDERATGLGPEWRQFTLSREFGRKTGFNGSTSRAAAAKWLWFQRHEPELWARTQSVMTISDYFVFALTGERVGDAGTAALLGTYDLAAQAWWPEALAHYGVDTKRFSEPLRPGKLAGRTSVAASRLGLPAGLPVAVGGLDHHVAALGAGLGTLAEVSISTGTVLAALALADGIIPQQHCYHGPHFDGRGFYRLVFDTPGAGQLEEFQRAFAPACSVEQLIAHAEKIPAGTRPHQPPRVEDSAVEQAVHVRHILERISSAHRGLLRRLAGDRTIRGVVATGGAARSDVWLQIQADMLGLPVSAQLLPESACLGAAMLASVVAGSHPTLGAAAKVMCRAGRQYLPDSSTTAVYRVWVPDNSESPT